MVKSKFVGLRLDENLYNIVADAARHEGESLSELIRRILAQHFASAGQTEADGENKNNEL